ncbi:MAG TPA: Maf family protein [Chloroflexia bacterium]|nr:Maf family protein [Chloroflexia bacterium]
MPQVILASASPRRQELIRRLVPSFSTVVSTVEEVGSETYPEWELEPLALPAPFSVPHTSDPRLWAWRKAVDALSTLSLEQSADAIVLAADTVVIAPGELLGKPVDTTDALRMLTLLRGQAHYVATGFVLVRAEGTTPRTLHSQAVLTRVIMRQFGAKELEGYVATGEHSDKAGAYALQGLGGRLIEHVEGCVTTVIGLPLCAVQTALTAFQVDVLPRPEGGYCNFCMHQYL